MPADRLRVVILKPSKYGSHGLVERFRRGFMPNSTVPYLRALTPDSLDGIAIETHAIDEYVRTDLEYLKLFQRGDTPTLIALVGVQSHQFQRAVDLAAYALENGVRHCVIGGPHSMTCDTSMLHGRGVSFALAEAEMIWIQILRDAIRGELAPVYGADQRWKRELEAPVLTPPSKRDLQRYFVPMIGIYPARGCPFTCNFCSVIKIAGHRIRSQNIETTIETLKAAKAAGVRFVMFTSDNFNKYPEAADLLERMIEERIDLPFFVQCDTQIARQTEFVELLGRARCFQMFIGVESFSRQALLSVHKAQNHPELYDEIVRLCREQQIITHFSNIIGFPDDTEESIIEHLDVLRSLRPDYASFYILTPIPGTQQYDEYLQAGRITEKNLDRFDAMTPTWKHPEFTPARLQSLLYRCYREFFSPEHLLFEAIESLKPRRRSLGLLPAIGYPLFAHWSALRERHPMSGGVGHVKRDQVSDYLSLRRRRYGFDLLPLPQSLELSAADAQFNRMGLHVSA
jgi:radical SAM family protein